MTMGDLQRITVSGFFLNIYFFTCETLDPELFSNEPIVILT